MKYRIRGFLTFIAVALTSIFNLSCRGIVPVALPPQPIAVKPADRVGSHVFLVMLENQKYEVIVGRPPAPYINSLIAKGGLATNFIANQHPSIANYFFLTVGKGISDDLNFGGVVDDDNLAREFGKNGISWRAYLESLPSVGYLKDGPQPYVKSHNPFAYFSDIRLLPAQANNMVPFSHFSADLANHNLASFTYIAPNQIHDMHDCPPPGGASCTNEDKIRNSDTWLQDNLGPLLDSPEFQKDGLLILTWDESFDTDFRSDNSCDAKAIDTNICGGRIAAILVGPKVKGGFQSTTLYHHQSILRLIEEALGIPNLLGNAATAPKMDEFLIGN